MLRLIAVSAALLALSGCAGHALDGPPLRTEAFIHLQLVDEVPQGKDFAGYTECTETGICQIWIRKDHYPLCSQHELGHVTHGPWHGYKPTGCTIYY